MTILPKINPKLKSFIFALLITLFVFIIKSNKIITQKNFSPILRLLYKEAEHITLCDEAEGDLSKKYSNDYEITIEDHELTKYQKKIIDKMREKDGVTDGIKASVSDYLPRLWVFVFFLTLIIIFIGFWICYLCFACCDCSCFKVFVLSSETYKFVIYLVSLLIGFIALILTIIILINISSLMKYANGTGCAVFNVFRQIIEGDSKDNLIGEYYIGLDPMITNKEEFEKLLKEYKNNNEFDSSMTNAITLYNNLDEESKSQFTQEANLLLNFYNTKDRELKNFENEVSNKLSSLNNFTYYLKNKENIVDDEIYDLLDSYIVTHLKRFLNAVFILILGFNIFDMVCLLMFYIYRFYQEAFKVIYTVIWNCEMLFIILGIIVCSITGALGKVAYDTINIIDYLRSRDNLNDTKPIFFNNTGDFYPYLAGCFNDNNLRLDFNVSYNYTSTRITEAERIKTLLDSKTVDNDSQIAKMAISSALREYILNLKNREELLAKLKVIDDDNPCYRTINDIAVVYVELDKANTRANVVAALGYMISILKGVSILLGIIVIESYRQDMFPHDTVTITPARTSIPNSTLPNEKNVFHSESHNFRNRKPTMNSYNNFDNNSIPPQNNTIYKPKKNFDLPPNESENTSEINKPEFDLGNNNNNNMNYGESVSPVKSNDIRNSWMSVISHNDQNNMKIHGQGNFPMDSIKGDISDFK